MHNKSSIVVPVALGRLPNAHGEMRWHSSRRNHRYNHRYNHRRNHRHSSRRSPTRNHRRRTYKSSIVIPVAPGRFVFAPMVKIAWGKSILLIEVGLAVELPSPLRLAILGKVHLLLPPTGNDAQKKPDKAVEIHLDVLGILDLDRNEISVDAVLYDSRLAIFPITGGMALRIKWGADPMFLLAIGGFNHVAGNVQRYFIGERIEARGIRIRHQ